MNVFGKPVFTVLLAAVLSGCASQIPFREALQSYEGPPRARAEVAVVYCNLKGEDGALMQVIETVDGRRIMLTHAAPVEIYVLPGHHEFDMHTGQMTTIKTADGTVKIDAEAGHTYAIFIRLSDKDTDTVRWHVQDLGTNYVRTDPIYQEALQHGFEPLR